MSNKFLVLRSVLKLLNHALYIYFGGHVFWKNEIFSRSTRIRRRFKCFIWLAHLIQATPWNSTVECLRRTSKCWCDCCRIVLCEISRIYWRKQFYSQSNCFGLYWKCFPPPKKKNTCFMGRKVSSGHKLLKEHITIMFYGNASGDHKMKLLMIRKAKKPCPFKGTE